MDVPAREFPAVAGADDAGSQTATPTVEEDLFTALLDAESHETLPGAWLALQCQRVGGCLRGRLLLAEGGSGPFTPVASWPAGDGGSGPLIEAAEQALRKGEGAVLPPGTAKGGGAHGAVVAEPVRLAGTVVGVVVFELAPAAHVDLGRLRDDLRLGFGWLDAVLQRRRMQGQEIRRSQLESVLALLAAGLEHERFQGAVTAFATELASELGCDRVSVGFRPKQRSRVHALSHSASFGHRTNLVRAIETAMDEALDQDAMVVYPADSGTLRADHAHAELSRQFGATHVCTVPLRRAGRVCGAITVEGSHGLDPRARTLLEVAAALSGPVLEDRRRDDRLVVAKVWESFRHFLDQLVGPRHVALKLVTVAALAVLSFLVVATGTYRVTADTILEPAVQRASVAPFDGYIAEAQVRAGDRVESGHVLAVLDDRDLRLERVKWESELGRSTKQYRQALAERDAAESEIQAASVAEARAELDRIQDRLSRTALRAPFDGVVVSGDLSQQLGAPVRRGDVLFEVAPLQAYRVKTRVRESDIAEVEVGQRGVLVLTSLPHDHFPFSVEKITPVSVAEEGHNTFWVEARLDQPDLRLRPGLEGVAKIDVDERRLIWIWTHEALNWLRLELWAWTP